MTDKKPIYVVEWTNRRTGHNGTTQVRADTEEEAKKAFKDYCHQIGWFDRKVDFVYPKKALKAASKRRL